MRFGISPRVTASPSARHTISTVEAENWLGTCVAATATTGVAGAEVSGHTPRWLAPSGPRGEQGGDLRQKEDAEQNGQVNGEVNGGAEVPRVDLSRGVPAHVPRPCRPRRGVEAAVRVPRRTS